MPAITAKRIEELMEMSRGLYLTMVGMTETPHEAVNIITMMHVCLWLNHNAGGDVSVMLIEYVRNFKENLQANEDALRKVVN